MGKHAVPRGRETGARQTDKEGLRVSDAAPARDAGSRLGRDGAANPRHVYAALDLGTNNCRLLVARPLAQGFRVIDAFSRIVRLGEGLSASGRLSEAAMARTLDALRVCAAKMRRRGVTRARAVATEACRRAGNCDAFLARVRRETGIELEIISNDEEANLAIYGCAPLLDRRTSHALVFDIGGGSTELGCMEVPSAPDRHGRIVEPRPCGWYSIPIGVVTLTERHGGSRVTPRVYDTMVEEVATAIAPFEAKHGLSALVADRQLQMLGTSGTVTTLCGIHQKLRRYDRARVDGRYLDFESARRISQRLVSMSHEARAAEPCIGPERADLMIAGCAILEALCSTWPVGRLRVADRGLREGILFMLMRGADAIPAGPT
ncbi:MAG: Ppx/GppA family phosphatase [Proteobacteria bacterium]|nr:Ppx/GppA family phosphatase [Pseudomonadota bacterium]